jgi:uncharacterized membrane protein YdbT with pleckstrin-like domain
MQYEKIWKKVLSGDERVEHEFSVGSGYTIYSFVAFCLVALLFLILKLFGWGIFISTVGLLYALYLKYANAFAFTNKRILIHRGLLSTKTISVDYNKITDVSVYEPFMERIISHTGNININTAGSGKTEIVLLHVTEPYELKKKLDVLKDK